MFVELHLIFNDPLLNALSRFSNTIEQLTLALEREREISQLRAEQLVQLERVNNQLTERLHASSQRFANEFNELLKENEQLQIKLQVFFFFFFFFS